MARNKRLCLVTRIGGSAGPASFQRRLAFGLAKRNVDVCFSLRDRPYDAVLVIGASRRMVGLWRARRSGIRIVQRLDGINWIHKRRRTGLRHYLRAELNNALLQWTRDRLAQVLVYQSQFVRRWWEEQYGRAGIPSTVIHNGVPLDLYSPGSAAERATNVWRLLVAEANFAGGYEIGLECAIRLAERVQKDGARKVELVIAGSVPAGLRQRWAGQAQLDVQWLGVVPSEKMPALDRSAHLFYAADIHPACPNAVIEAIACGLPVAGFDTGALAELVTEDAGRVVPYGGDPWQLDPPDIDGLAEAALEILADEPRYRSGARRRAEAAFGLDQMVESYLSVLGWI